MGWPTGIRTTIRCTARRAFFVYDVDVGEGRPQASVPRRELHEVLPHDDATGVLGRSICLRPGGVGIGLQMREHEGLDSRLARHAPGLARRALVVSDR
jgi:hypothetical protein